MFAKFKKFQNRKIIYGVTDCRDDPFLVKVNDFLINHSRISKKEKELFFHSLQMLVKSGVRFVRALEILAKRTKNLRFRRILHTIVYDMENRGMSFSQSLEKHPAIFTKSEVKVVFSGEIAGRLEETLESIAKQLRANLKLEIQVRSALMYPFTVICAIVVAAIVVMLLVVPKFEMLFSEFSNSSLPIATQILIGASKFLQNFWWFVVATVIAATLIFKNWKNSDDGRLVWDRFLLDLPIFSSLVQNIQTVRVANNFSMLIKSGVPIAESLKILAEIIPNRAVSDSIFQIEKDVRDGKTIHESFRNSPALDPIFGEAIEIGEKSGNMSEVLEKIGAQYELEVDAQLRNMTTLIEPFVILIVGGMVIFLAMAIMTPIFRLQELFLAT